MNHAEAITLALPGILFKRREPVVTSDPQRIAIAKKAACCLGCRGLEFGDALVAELIAKSQ
jgi:hypothetical protein